MSDAAGGDGVLVLDSGQQTAVTVIRSLGGHGVDVTAGGTAPRTPGMLSRYAADSYVHPDPATDRAAFVCDLRTHLERSEYTAVVPVTDHSSLLLSRAKARLEETGTAVGCEDWPTFRRAFDKAALFDLLGPLDVPTPETHAPRSLAAVRELGPDLDYPVVVKPRSKSYLTADGYAVSRVDDDSYARSPSELVATCRRLRRDDWLGYADPIVQEYVPGTTTTTVALADQGTVVAQFQEERLRTYPASGGNSALLAALREPEMLAHAERVLAALEWTGPAMVEFMRTPAGEYSVIEVNGRYWGSLPFAVRCGVDFPWYHYRQLHGADLSGSIQNGDYRTDIVQRRLFFEDVKWLLEQLEDGNVGALGPFVQAFWGSEHTVVDTDDPVPMLAALGQAALLGARHAGSDAAGVGRRLAGRVSYAWRD